MCAFQRVKQQRRGELNDIERRQRNAAYGDARAGDNTAQTYGMTQLALLTRAYQCVVARGERDSSIRLAT